jgi:hypothetical protein
MLTIYGITVEKYVYKGGSKVDKAVLETSGRLAWTRSGGSRRVNGTVCFRKSVIEIILLP